MLFIVFPYIVCLCFMGVFKVKGKLLLYKNDICYNALLSLYIKVCNRCIQEYEYYLDITILMIHFFTLIYLNLNFICLLFTIIIAL